ncbi:hypothetical protein [Corallococcus sp. 4LFB]|uniref:hypothetical protein n=1 Tax=Corallococcus sp. 4LFB TaxID=3383249 RepID=UPI003975B7B0
MRTTMAQLSSEPAPDAGLESLLAYAQQSARRAAAGPSRSPRAGAAGSCPRWAWPR